MIENLRAMAIFVAVADSGSFRAAARELGISSTSVFNQIAALERRLDCQLLDRDGGHVQVTQKGQSLLISSRSMLRSAETGIRSTLAANIEIEGRISISVTAMLASGIVSEVLEEFLMRHPKIQIEVGFQTAQMHPLHENVDVTIGPELIANTSGPIN